MVRVIVTGGRDYGELDFEAVLKHRPTETIRVRRQIQALFEVLDFVHAKRGITCIIEGRCPTGADKHAREWARRNGVATQGYPARWDVDGKKAAGPKRNTRMVTESEADGCVATEGNRGTADCIRKCEKAGIPVMHVRKS